MRDEGTDATGAPYFDRAAASAGPSGRIGAESRASAVLKELGHMRSEPVLPGSSNETRGLDLKADLAEQELDKRRLCFHSWKLPPGERGILSRRRVQVVVSLFAIAVLLSPTWLIGAPNPNRAGASGVKAFSGPVPSAVGDFPGFISPAQIASPDNVTGPGQYGYLQLASGVVGTSPTYWLLYVWTAPGGHSDLELVTGAYNPTQAWQIASKSTCVTSGYSCFHHSVTWGAPDNLLNSSSVITADALAAWGIVVIVAYTVGGSTTLIQSNDGGTSWTTLTTVTGTNPSTYVDSAFAILAYQAGGKVWTYSQQLFCGSTGTSTSTGVIGQNATPVQLPNGSLAVVLSNSSSQLVQIVALNSARTAYLTPVAIGRFLSSSTSSIFSQIGSTSLATPGGWPGQVAVITEGTSTVVAYTGSVGGRVQLESLASPDSGRHWQGPYVFAAGMGAAQDPTLALLPSGEILASWRSNDNGTWEQQEGLLGEDGRLLYGPASSVGSGGLASAVSASSSTVVDARGLVFSAWLSTSASGVQIEFDGDDLGPVAMLSLFAREAENLQSADFAPGDASDQGLLIVQLEAAESDVSGGSYSSAVTILETEVFPEVSTSSLVLGCDATVPLSACTTLIAASSAYILASATGPSSPSSYLQQYLAWSFDSLGIQVPLPASGFSSQYNFACGSSGHQLALLPSSSLTNSTSLLPPSGSSGTPSSWVNVSASGSAAEGRAVPLNPKAAYLSVAWRFASNSSAHTSHGTPCGGSQSPGTCYVSFCNESVPYSYTVQIGLSSTYQGSTSTDTFSLPGNASTVRLTNLTYNGVSYWDLEVTGHYKNLNQTITTHGSGCAQAGTWKVRSFSNRTLGPGWGSTWTTDNVTSGNVTEQSSTSVWANWTTSLPSKGWLNWSTGIPHGTANQAGPANTTGQSFVASSLLSGWYNYTESALSNQSATPRSPPPSYDSLGVGGSLGWPDPKITVTKEFWGLSANNLVIDWPSVTNITSSNATLSFYTNYATSSSVTYSEEGPGFSQEISSIASKPVSNGTYKTLVEIHGLVPWATYNLTILAISNRGGISYDKTLTGTSFNSAATFETWESDSPYDSVTQEGGGALISWFVPASVYTYYSFVNGTVYYWPTNNVSAEVVLPVTDVLQVGTESEGVNVTPYLANTSYTFVAQMNYSLNSNHQVVYTATSAPYVFIYHRDTSGDGLTDAEKTAGWSVTTQNAAAQYSTSGTFANPRLYASNGLTNDFIEKEFGLNPNRLSTTSDGMLDMWNLTFDLGSGSPALPTSGFQYWYENGSYNFTRACPQPALRPPCSGAARDVDYSNLSDNSPGSSEILWSGAGSSSALTYFESLLTSENSGIWLRAVTGTYGSHRTITVVGKLSWGANPLAYSTPEYLVGGSGVPDGDLLDPLSTEFLNVSILSWWDTGVTSGTGVAPYISAKSPTAPFYPSGQVDYSGYGPSVRAGGTSASYPGTFTVNFPVVPTEQNITLNLSLVSKGSVHFTWRNASSITIDLWNTSVHAQSWTPTGFAINVSYAVEPTYFKAPTTIIVPGDNSTLSPLPTGLQRYTGEENFVLLEVNDTIGGSNSISQGGIPFVNSSATHGISTATYSFSLSGGMNNILVPRTLFKNSPLGQALLNGTLVSIHPWGYNSFLQPNWAAGFWKARATGTTFNGTNYSYPSRYYIKIYSNTNQNCSGGSECGGIPDDPAAEANASSFAIGAILTLNITNPNGLEDLLAGLLLNASGNFTSWGFQTTQFLPSMDLGSEVESALANPVLFNEGAYGAPVYSGSNSLRAVWQTVGSSIWNTVSGVVAGGASVAWNWISAAGSYAAYIVDQVATWGLSALSQSASVLRDVAGAMVWAIEQLASFVLGLLNALVAAAFSPIWLELKAGVHELTSLQSSSSNATSAYIDSTGSLAKAIGSTSEALAPFIAIGLILTILIYAALGVALPVSIGIGVLITLLISVIISIAGSGALSSVGGGFQNQVVSQSASALTSGTAELRAVSESFMNWTFAKVLGSNLTTNSLQPVPDPPDYVGAIGVAGASGGVALPMWYASRLPVDARAAIGLDLAIASLALTLYTFLFEYLQPNGCNDLPYWAFDSILTADIAGAFLTAPSAGLDGDALFNGGTLLTREVGAFGLGLDVVGLITGLIALGVDKGCSTTAY
jgi:hypothetical protein